VAGHPNRRSSIRSILPPARMTNVWRKVTSPRTAHATKKRRSPRNQRRSLCLALLMVRQVRTAIECYVREGKTEAAAREVPIHDAAAHVLERRHKSSDGFVFNGLMPGGPDKKRSWNASKAFGRYTRALGLGEQRQVFHALRNTFIEAMEAPEVPEGVTKLIVGHKRTSLTYGHYSRGDRVSLRKYINKLRYPDDVMRLIRGKGRPSRPAKPKHGKRKRIKRK
jgi:hypothetical protein